MKKILPPRVCILDTLLAFVSSSYYYYDDDRQYTYTLYNIYIYIYIAFPVSSLLDYLLFL